jgi:hypothetical protein
VLVRSFFFFGALVLDECVNVWCRSTRTVGITIRGTNQLQYNHPRPLRMGTFNGGGGGGGAPVPLPVVRCVHCRSLEGPFLHHPLGSNHLSETGCSGFRYPHHESHIDILPTVLHFVTVQVARRAVWASPPRAPYSCSTTGVPHMAVQAWMSSA